MAVYEVEYASGRCLDLQIRERFEIGVIPCPYGEWPFLTQVDQPAGLMPRHDAGTWDKAGTRVAEVTVAGPRAFHLWPWHNPHPDDPVARIRVRDAQRSVYLGAITASDLAESPFRRSGSRVVTMTTQTPSTFDDRHSSAHLSVDRGETTYAHPLPEDRPHDRITDPLRGWGARRLTESTRLYARVAATPSATLALEQDTDTVGTAVWQDVLETEDDGGTRHPFAVRPPGLNWVRVSIRDADTGELVPCRVHFEDLVGVPFQPHAHHDHVYSDMQAWNVQIGGDLRLGRMSYAYVHGRCEGWLPQGLILVDVARGFEWEPAREVVTIEPGQRELTLTIRRFADMAAEGWYCGDTHVHFTGGQSALTQAAAEDLNVVNLLAAQWGQYFSNAEDFLGQGLWSDDGRHVVYCSQEN